MVFEGLSVGKSGPSVVVSVVKLGKIVSSVVVSLSVVDSSVEVVSSVDEDPSQPVTASPLMVGRVMEVVSLESEAI
jgi:hypothetical protein